MYGFTVFVFFFPWESLYTFSRQPTFESERQEKISLIFSLAGNMRACNSYVSFLAKDCTCGPGLFSAFYSHHSKI